jgi:uncharacterized protein YndB with AHSA1/START domain
MRECSHTLVISAPPAAVLDAFFEPEALAAWWDVTRAICVPRPLGGYALEWAPTDWRDEDWAGSAVPCMAPLWNSRPGGSSLWPICTGTA